MAVNDCSYTNSAATKIDLNGTDYQLVHPGPQGIYSLTVEPIITASLRKLPVGVYEEHGQTFRNIVVPIRVVGTSWSDLVTNIRVLWAAFYVDARDSKLGVFNYIAPNSIDRSIECALSEETDVEEWLAAGLTDPANATVNVPLVCPDPTFYGATVTPSGVFDGTNDVNVSCANAGDVDAYLTITYTTDADTTLENPSVTDKHNRVLTITETMAVSKVLILTLEPQELSMLYDTSTDWFGKRGVSQLVVAKHGTNNLTFTADNAGADAAIGISFASRYSAHG